MKSWILAAILVSLGSLFFAMLIANTGYMGNGYYATIEIQILVLIGTIIICTGLIVNALRATISSGYKVKLKKLYGRNGLINFPKFLI